MGEGGNCYHLAERMVRRARNEDLRRKQRLQPVIVGMRSGLISDVDLYSGWCVKSKGIQVKIKKKKKQIAEMELAISCKRQCQHHKRLPAHI